jgi:hypothetical protein
MSYHFGCRKLMLVLAGDDSVKTWLQQGHKNLQIVSWSRHFGPEATVGSWLSLDNKCDAAVLRHPGCSSSCSMLLYMALSGLCAPVIPVMPCFHVTRSPTVLKPGARIYLYGCAAEGVMSAPALMGAIPALGDVRLVRCSGSSAVVTAVVSSNKKRRKTAKRVLKDFFHSVDIHGFPVPEGEADAPIRSKRSRADAPIDRADSDAAATVAGVSFKWTVAPGLFAGGVVDIMTLAMIKCIDRPHGCSKNLDYACGSGIIAKWLLLAEPSCQVTMCDNDTVALEVAKMNNPKAEAVLSDSWDSISEHPHFQEGSCAFDNIYSNPPLHRGKSHSPPPLVLILDHRLLQDNPMISLCCTTFVREHRAGWSRAARCILLPRPKFQWAHFCAWQSPSMHALRPISRQTTGLSYGRLLPSKQWSLLIMCTYHRRM